MARGRSARLAARKSKTPINTPDSKEEDSTHHDDSKNNAAGDYGEPDKSGEEENSNENTAAGAAAAASPLISASVSIARPVGDKAPVTRRARRTKHQKSAAKSAAKTFATAATATSKPSWSAKTNSKALSSSKSSKSSTSSTSLTTKMKTLTSYFTPKEKPPPSPSSEEEAEEDGSDHSDDEFMSVDSNNEDEKDSSSLSPPADQQQSKETSTEPCAKSTPTSPSESLKKHKRLKLEIDEMEEGDDKSKPDPILHQGSSEPVVGDALVSKDPIQSKTANDEKEDGKNEDSQMYGSGKNDVTEGDTKESCSINAETENDGIGQLTAPAPSAKDGNTDIPNSGGLADDPTRKTQNDGSTTKEDESTPTEASGIVVTRRSSKTKSDATKPTGSDACEKSEETKDESASDTHSTGDVKNELSDHKPLHLASDGTDVEVHGDTSKLPTHTPTDEAESSLTTRDSAKTATEESNTIPSRVDGEMEQPELCTGRPSLSTHAHKSVKPLSDIDMLGDKETGNHAKQVEKVVSDGEKRGEGTTAAVNEADSDLRNPPLSAGHSEGDEKSKCLVIEPTSGTADENKNGTVGNPTDSSTLEEAETTDRTHLDDLAKTNVGKISVSSLNTKPNPAEISGDICLESDKRAQSDAKKEDTVGFNQERNEESSVHSQPKDDANEISNKNSDDDQDQSQTLSTKENKAQHETESNQPVKESMSKLCDSSEASSKIDLLSAVQPANPEGEKEGSIDTEEHDEKLNQMSKSKDRSRPKNNSSESEKLNDIGKVVESQSSKEEVTLITLISEDTKASKSANSLVDRSVYDFLPPPNDQTDFASKNTPMIPTYPSSPENKVENLDIIGYSLENVVGVDRSEPSGVDSDKKDKANAANHSNVSEEHDTSNRLELKLSYEKESSSVSQKEFVISADVIDRSILSEKSTIPSKTSENRAMRTYSDIAMNLSLRQKLESRDEKSNVPNVEVKSNHRNTLPDATKSADDLAMCIDDTNSCQYGSSGVISKTLPQAYGTRHTHSADKLKMALFLEGSKVHRGFGNERIFANYWETLERYITFGSHDQAKSARSNLDTQFGSIEATLNNFLKSRKMKRLHNKFVRAIMLESLSPCIPAKSAAHLPENWKKKTRVHSATHDHLGLIGKINTHNREPPVSTQRLDLDDNLDDIILDTKSNLHQWNDVFGSHSGVWSTCGDEIAISESQVARTNHTDFINNTNTETTLDEEVLPSARLPGALEIDPFLRKNVENSDMSISENAMWMLVVAVREHSAAIIKATIASKKDLDDGFLSSQPKSFMTTLACEHLFLEKKSVDKASEKSAAPVTAMKKRGRVIIDATDLSHALASNPLLAGGSVSRSSSRLAWMRSISSSDSKGAYCLENLNCVVNAAIERAASKRQRLSQPPEQITTAPIAAPLLPVSTTSTKNGSKTKASNGQSKLSAHAQPFQPSAPPHSIQLSNVPNEEVAFPPTSLAANCLDSSNSVAPSETKTRIEVTKRNHVLFPTAQIPKSDMPEPQPHRQIPSPKTELPTNTNLSEKIELQPNSEPTPNPPQPRRGSKNLAAMISRTTSRPSSSTGVKNDSNDAGTITAAIQKEESGENEDFNKESTTPPASPDTSSRPRGKGGFGVKNLAAMRARSTVGSESGESGK